MTRCQSDQTLVPHLCPPGPPRALQPTSCTHLWNISGTSSLLLSTLKSLFCCRQVGHPRLTHAQTGKGDSSYPMRWPLPHGNKNRRMKTPLTYPLGRQRWGAFHTTPWRVLSGNELQLPPVVTQLNKLPLDWRFCLLSLNPSSLPLPFLGITSQNKPPALQALLMEEGWVRMSQCFAYFAWFQKT